MPLFYFNLWDSKAFVADPQGIELPNLDAVREEAIKSALEVLTDGQAKGEDRTGWTFEVKDAQDHTVLQLPFARAITAAGEIGRDSTHAEA